MYDLVQDVADITTINKSTLDKLTQKSIFCICHDIEENIIKNESITIIDLGIGTLSIKVESVNNEIKYKFIPSKKLENSVRTTISEKQSPLVDEIQNAVKNKVLSAYKDLF